jgi:hypothetical protein
MIPVTELTDLRNSLSTGFFADRVVTTLARTQRVGQVRKEDQPLLEDALKLLQQIQEGAGWLDSKKFNSHSSESALAFDRATSALAFNTQAPDKFIEHIGNLQAVINKLLENKSASDKDIKLLRDFFYGYGKGVFAEARKIIERPGEPEGVHLWRRGQ